MLLNYTCPRHVLEPFVPTGTVLDDWHGETIVSVVGFMFKDTRVMSVAIPRHVHFEEVNLRFYVSRTTAEGEMRRAVVFVRELVPRTAIAAIARWCYNEPYLAVPMSHQCSLDESRGGSASYTWVHGNGAFALSAEVSGPAAQPASGSEAEFITEHYWGYTRQRDGGTLEYRVEHPAWKVWEARNARLTGPLSSLYGETFGEVLRQTPRSAYVAKGSAVAVHRGLRLG